MGSCAVKEEHAIARAQRGWSAPWFSIELVERLLAVISSPVVEAAAGEEAEAPCQARSEIVAISVRFSGVPAVDQSMLHVGSSGVGRRPECITRKSTHVG